MTTRLLGRPGDRTQSARNQHALRAASPRTPTPMLLALLRACSFRLEGEAVAWRFRCELGLVAPLLPAAPLFPAFGTAPSPFANSQPKQRCITPTQLCLCA